MVFSQDVTSHPYITGPLTLIQGLVHSKLLYTHTKLALDPDSGTGPSQTVIHTYRTGPLTLIQGQVHSKLLYIESYILTQDTGRPLILPSKG